MGLNLGIKTQTLATPEDQSWLGSREGTESAEPITLDSALFTNTPFPNGIVKSGTVIAKVTATGKYGPFVSNLSNGQELPIGFLLTTVDLTGGIFGQAVGDTGGALLWRGRIVSAKVPQGTGVSTTTPGALDTVARTAPTDLTAVSAQEAAVLNFQSRFRIV